MKQLISLTLFVLLLIFGACTSNKTEGQNNSTSSESTVEVINLTPQEFFEKSSKGIILDVRTPEEIAQGKISNSQALDFYDQDFVAKVTALPKDQEIFLYCAGGGRSTQAAQLLLQQGYTQVYQLDGGIQAWHQQGFPIE